MWIDTGLSGSEGGPQRQRPVTTTVALCCFGVPPGPLVLMIITVVSTGLPGERKPCGSCLSFLLMMSLERSGFGGLGQREVYTAPDFLETLTLSLMGFAAKTGMDFDN